MNKHADVDFTDHELIELIRNGDENARNILVTRYYEFAMQSFQHEIKIYSKKDKEDIICEGFKKFLDKKLNNAIEKYHAEEGTVKAFMLKCIWNCVSDELKKRTKIRDKEKTLDDNDYASYENNMDVENLVITKIILEEGKELFLQTVEKNIRVFYQYIVYGYKQIMEFKDEVIIEHSDNKKTLSQMFEYFVKSFNQESPLPLNSSLVSNVISAASKENVGDKPMEECFKNNYDSLKIKNTQVEWYYNSIFKKECIRKWNHTVLRKMRRFYKEKYK